MLSETLISVVLEASVTGAGLILAIYTLVTPLLDKIIKVRKELIAEKKQRFDNLAEKIKTERSDVNLRQVNTLYKELKDLRSFPNYLGSGVFVVFLLYTLTLSLAISWFFQPLPKSPITELLLLFAFGGANGGFFVVGIYTIAEVARTMNHEWKKLEKEKEEVEKSTGERLKKLRKQKS